MVIGQFKFHYLETHQCNTLLMQQNQKIQEYQANKLIKTTSETNHPKPDLDRALKKESAAKDPVLDGVFYISTPR